MRPITTTIGPNASANTDSPWIRLDEWAGGQISFQAVLTNSATYSIQTTNQDPNDLFNPVANPAWDSTLTGVAGATTSSYGTLSAVPLYIKIRLTSGNGSIALTVVQNSSVPF